MNRFEKQELQEHFKLSKKIDKILDLAGFNIFPAGADKDRREATQAILDLIESEVKGRVQEVINWDANLRADFAHLSFPRKKLRGKDE